MKGNLESKEEGRDGDPPVLRHGDQVIPFSCRIGMWHVVRRQEHISLAEKDMNIYG